MIKQGKLDMIGLIAGSINAQIVSLMGQLNDYDFLDVSIEQIKKLDWIERNLHQLVDEIVNQQPKENKK